MNSDLMLGLALNMTWKAVEPWAVSVRRSGFDGDVVLFVLPDAPADLVSNLVDLNITAQPLENIEFSNPLVPFGQYFPYVGRFLLTYRYLTEHPGYRYVICSDVRDLVFFKNPSERLYQYMNTEDNKRDLIVTGENILHCNQLGNMEWMRKGFKEVQDFLTNEEVYCSGLIAGVAEPVRELALSIYLMGRELSDTIWGVDQPVYNFLMHGAYRYRAYVPSLQDGWCLNMAVPATIGDLTKMMDPSIFETDAEDKVKVDLYRFAAVHQYDRISALAAEIRRRFQKN